MDRDDVILDYLQNQLAPDERAAFEADMARDTSLAAEVSVLQSVRVELASGPMHENASAVWDKLSDAMDTPTQAANDNRRSWLQIVQYAAACVIAVAVWQLTVVPRLGAPDDGFRAASEQSADFVLQVKFVEDATLVEIADLLSALGGTISDGPSALGIVRLSFADAQQSDQALDALNSRTDLVEFVSKQ